MAKKPPEKNHKAMVEAVRAGKSMRSVARRFNVTLPTVQRWVKRAQGLEL